jgi:hypothetical protein
MKEAPKKEQFINVETEQKLGIGVKILLTVIILGAVAAGVYASVALAQ